MQLHTIDTGFFKLDGGAMFGVVPRPLWQALNPPDAQNLCTWAMRCLLIEDGPRLLLVDNGIGNKQSEKFFSYYHLHGPASLAGSLAAAGAAPAQITDMLLTHLHFDHCGGGVARQGEHLLPVFTQANYWTNAAHWQWATQPNPREKASFLTENLLPMQQSGQLQMLPVPAGAPNGLHRTRFSENVELLWVDGHTEKQMLPLVSYRGRKILFGGDLIPSAGHLPVAYVMGYDVRPLVSMHEKELVLRQALAENWVLMFQHDPVHECCTLAQTERGIRGQDFFKLAELG
jgi:glyoxylase-like metal-dependent hydrolase (beta-lactamase superfamily II)